MDGIYSLDKSWETLGKKFQHDSFSQFLRYLEKKPTGG